ncbi:MAG: cation-translocating P-type ATPase [Pseudomonadales bacterium]|nr:cation-translocating P-type ATPase [Pseudomonadales bacterium]
MQSSPPAAPAPARALSGLSEAEAAARLRRDGANDLPSQRRRGLAPIVAEVMREPMFLMLVAAGALYLLMGAPGDALLLLGFVFVVIGITVVQERRTEHALDALRDLSSPRALVVRDGVHKRIAGREVVVGDLVLLAEGDRVPADGILRQSSHLAVDESLLTGESVPVRKRASLAATTLDRPGGDDLPSLFSGSLVTAGQGLCEVLRTGTRTELGRIGRALAQIEPETTPLQTETGAIVRTLARVGLGACALVIVLYALTRGADVLAWKQGALAGIAMAMALLPEEFPVVLTVFLALGAWRIAQRRVLTRRMAAIETLGAATVLCVDKTGTLTENRMTLARLAANGESLDCTASGAALTPPFRAVLEAALGASRAEPFDPMERALHAAAAQWDMAPRSGRLVREYPLSAALLAVTQIWEDPQTGVWRAAAKGAPEAIAQLCRLTIAERAALTARVGALAATGLRVLGVAAGDLPAGELPATQPELQLRLLGLIAFTDPLRAEVPAAVAECRSAGIRVVMITGDYPATARDIARQAGFGDAPAVLTGAELDTLTDSELAARIGAIQVFARVVPEQKLRLVNALKANGEVVAMTGDGVNDAPALKAAHIGIAMGKRGTDVAREAADLVLLDDAFASIVNAVRLGRRIYDNIRKAMVFILAVHVPIAGLSMIPVFFPSWPLLLLPIHIVFLELIIDPACSLIFEAERAEADIMERPPRRRDQRLFAQPAIAVALLQGASALAVCLAIFVFRRPDHGAEAARALTFAALVVALLAIILINRSWSRSALAMLGERNPALWWVVSGALAVLAVAFFVAPVRALFSFAPLHLPDIGWSLLAGLVCLGWFELLKRTPWWRALQGRRQRPG